jgi:hypothetical protein
MIENEENILLYKFQEAYNLSENCTTSLVTNNYDHHSKL